MLIINKDRKIEKTEVQNNVIIKRGAEMSFCESHHISYMKTNINNLNNNNIRKGVQNGN